MTQPHSPDPREREMTSAVEVAGPCKCPLDWVACFRHDCPRAAAHRQQLAEQHFRFHRILQGESRP